MTIGARSRGTAASSINEVRRNAPRTWSIREDGMSFTKWLCGAAFGATLALTGSSAFAVTIGFSQVGDEGDWRPAFSKDMQEEAKKEGIDLKFADAQGKEED